MKQLLDLCNSIKSSNSSVEEIKKLATTILLKADVDESLEELNVLSYLLYAQNKADDALVICEKLKQIEFNDNYDRWTWIESSLALGARITREKNDLVRSQDYIAKIISPQKIGTEMIQKIKVKAFQRRLNGMLLKDDKINMYKERKDIELEREFRIVQMKELCFISEMGGSEEYTKELAEKFFNDNLEKLNTILS